MKYIILVFKEDEYRRFYEATETLKALSEGLGNDELAEEIECGLKAVDSATDRGYKWIKNKMI